jgi:hypothetical protein
LEIEWTNRHGGFTIAVSTRGIHHYCVCWDDYDTLGFRHLQNVSKENFKIRGIVPTRSKLPKINHEMSPRPGHRNNNTIPVIYELVVIHYSNDAL